MIDTRSPKEWAELRRANRKQVEQERWRYSEIKRCLVRDRGPSCEACGVTLPTKTLGQKHLVTHHIVPRADGGSDDPSNLMLLCGDCHYSQHDWCRGTARPPLPPGVVRPPQEDRNVSLAMLVERAIERRQGVTA